MPVPKGVRLGGRQKGTQNKRTRAIREAAAQTMDKVVAEIADAFEGDAHALLVSVYKNPAHDLHVRIDAAKAAVRYEKPALANVEATGKDGAPLFCPTVIEFVAPDAGED